MARAKPTEDATRLRGRAGMAQRKRRLAREPLCRECLKIGVFRPTDEIDHIKPLSEGGADTDDNAQGLCAQHHKAKSAFEDSAHWAAANHPDWLTPSNIPLTIISGPPCSGKTTHIETHAKLGDTIIDLDGIMMRLRPGYQHWSGAIDTGLLNRAIRTRNAMLGALSSASIGKAWFIVSAPSPAERAWWHGKLGGELLLLHPGADECKRRALQRGTPNAIAGIDEWQAASLRPWSSGRTRPEKVSIGEDGWPL